MNMHLVGWEIAGFFFVLIVGSLLHFAFELSNFWKPVALFAAVNESTWEHLKMVFWPGLFFFLMHYYFFKDKACATRFWSAKSVCLFLMPLIIAVGWYGAIALLAENSFAVNIGLFIGAIIIGQLVSYLMLSAKIPNSFSQQRSIIFIVVLALAFATLTFFPPKIFLFEHKDLENTGQYGILDNYEDLLIFDDK